MMNNFLKNIIKHGKSWGVNWEYILKSNLLMVMIINILKKKKNIFRHYKLQIFIIKKEKYHVNVYQ